MRDRLQDLNNNPPDGGSKAPAGEKPEKAEKAEKKDKEKKGAQGGEPQDNVMTGFFDEIGGINDSIATIKNNIEQIEALHNKALNTISEDQSTQNAKELDKWMDKTNKLAADIRNRLKAMDAKNKKLSVENPGSSDIRIRINQHSAAAKKFLDVMTEYKDIQKKYQDKYKQRMQRQFLIVKPGATPEEVEKMMDGDSGPVFAQQIMHSGQKAEAKKALQDIQDRHHDIQKIEQSIIELQQLFIDMAVLVQAQGEMLNQIEIHVENAKDHTDQGAKALHQAVKLQKKSRKKMCIIIVCLILLIVGVGLAVYFLTKH
ncbi:t-SNARE [Polychytrium aggregatum]|uniref:t-SNARE n=1 Tax=Polychytrium aggregatum TaxID=110093 RepID=UPI0022FE614D|nr:t-SNARE [Polychytrium aggregatum]KAI9208472.1 t-SNARE [Polychytrium aggregatum]